MNNIIKLANDYKSPVPAWLGNRLFFAIYDPKSLEIVLTHPNALAKSDLYHYLKAGVGEGIFTADGLLDVSKLLQKINCTFF